MDGRVVYMQEKGKCILDNYILPACILILQAIAATRYTYVAACDCICEGTEPKLVLVTHIIALFEPDVDEKDSWS